MADKDQDNGMNGTLRWLVIIAALGGLGGGVGGITTLAQNSTSESDTASLETKVEGQEKLFDTKIAALGSQINGLKDSVDAMVGTGAKIASDTGSIDANVQKLGFEVAALRAQILARIEADAKQDKAIDDLQTQIRELRDLIERGRQ